MTSLNQPVPARSTAEAFAAFAVRASRHRATRCARLYDQLPRDAGELDMALLVQAASSLALDHPVPPYPDAG